MLPKSPRLRLTIMTEQQPIIVPSRSPSPIPVPAPVPVLPDYDEDVRPSFVELAMNWSVLDDSQVNRAQLGSFVRDSARTMEYLLRADLACLNAMDEVCVRLLKGGWILTIPSSYVLIWMGLGTRL